MKISDFIKKLEKYRDKHGDLDVEMHERVVSCNNQSYTSPCISFYQSWREVPLYTEEELNKMSRRTLLKKLKEHGNDEHVKGVSDEDLRYILMEISSECKEILELGIQGES